MDRKKLIIVGVLVLLVVAVVAMRNAETPPAPETAATTETAPATETGAHSADDGHNHAEGDGHDHSAEEKSAPAPTATTTVKGNVTTLQKTDLKVGTGKTAKTGDNVTVHYRGTLTNGTKFDASYDRGQPFSFPLGGGQVIPGWDQGVVGMKEGGKRKLVIPSDLAYGDEGRPPTIPQKATLVFEVELLKVG